LARLLRAAELRGKPVRAVDEAKVGTGGVAVAPGASEARRTRGIEVETGSVRRSVRACKIRALAALNSLTAAPVRLVAVAGVRVVDVDALGAKRERSTELREAPSGAGEGEA
jgi:hypothetical protein